MTVVVPVFNPGPYFERTLSSLLHQTLPRSGYEVVVVDDGSTDGTADRLDRAAREHPDLVRVTHIANSGWPGRPRNTGTDVARFDYVFYCDADDWLPPDALEALLDRATHDDSDLVVSRAIGNRRAVPRALFERGDYCTTWRKTPGVFSNLTTQKLFRRGFLQENDLRFLEGKVRLEDFIFMTQAYLQAERISILGTRPCYVLERRHDRGNLTARATDQRDFYRSVERILDVIEANTLAGTDRDLALNRVLRSDIIGPLTRTGFLRRDEDSRTEVLARSRQLLLDRIPLSAEDRLDALTRRRAAAVRAGDRELLERWIPWESAVAAEVELAEVAWETGQLRVDLRLALLRDDEVVRLQRAGDRTWSPGPPDPETGRPAASDGIDVTDEVDRTSVHLILRSHDIFEEWRVRARVELRADARTAEHTELRWSATAVVDFSTIAGGRPLRAGAWDLYVTLASCGVQRERRVGATRAVALDEPLPAALGPLLVSPFWTGPGNLSFDVDQWERSFAAEVLRRGVGPATVDSRSMSVPLHLVAAGTPATLEVHLLPEGPRRTPPLVLLGTLEQSSSTPRLDVALPRLPSGQRWSVRLRWGGPGSGPTIPTGVDVVPASRLPGSVTRLLGRRAARLLHRWA